MDTQTIIVLVVLVIGILIAIYLASKRNYRETKLNRFDEYKLEFNKKTLKEQSFQEETNENDENDENDDDEEDDNSLYESLITPNNPSGTTITEAFGKILGLITTGVVFQSVTSTVMDEVNSLNVTIEPVFLQSINLMTGIIPVLILFGVTYIILDVYKSVTDSEKKGTSYKEKELNTHDKYRTAMNTKTLKKSKRIKRGKK